MPDVVDNRFAPGATRCRSPPGPNSEGLRRRRAPVRSTLERVSLEPQIRYCTTTDGVRIAYAIVGSGPHLVQVASPTTVVAAFDPIFSERRVWKSLTYIGYSG